MRRKIKKSVKLILSIVSTPFVYLWRFFEKPFRRERENFESEIEHEFDSQLKILEITNFLASVLKPLKPLGITIVLFARVIGYPFVLLEKMFNQEKPNLYTELESIDEADAKIIAIQKSTRTLFKFMIPPHNWLRSKLRWYYNWHLFSFSSQVHWASLALSTISLVGFFVYTLFPFSHSRAANYDKAWTSTADFNGGTNSNIDTTSDQTKLAQTTANFSEGFTGTTYKDNANTTANWDTVANKLNLPGDPVNGTAANLADKWKMALGSTESINAIVYDSANGYVYMGGSAGGLVAYNTTTQAVINLTSKISTNWSTATINTLAFDQTNKILYLEGGLVTGVANFGALVIGTDPSTSTWSYLSTVGTFSTDWGSNAINISVFDQTNKILYFGGPNGKFGAFNGGTTPASGTWYYLTTVGSFATDMGVTTVSAITFDTTNNIVYLNGGSKIGAFNGGANPSAGTWYYLTTIGTFAADWGSYAINAMTFDSVYGYVYLAGGGASAPGFGVFAVSATPSSDTWTNLPGKISTDFSTTYPPRSATYDSFNKIVYIGGDGAKLGAYNGGATPASGTFTSLTSKMSSDWATNKSIKALTFDTTANMVYLGGTSGAASSKFGSFNGGATPSSGTWTNLSTKFYLSRGYDLYSSVYDSTNNFIYLGGSNGEFAVYNPSTGIVTDLTSKISTNWSTNTINAMAFDSTNGVIYLGGSNGKFGAFNGGANPAAGTWYYLTTVGTFSTNWSTNQVNALSFDSHNGIMYLGGVSGKFGAFAGGATPSSGTWYYLTTIGTFSTDWSTNQVNAITYDSTNYIIYLGGGGNKFGAFNGGVTPTSGTWTSLTNSWVNNIYGLAFDSVNSIVYLAGSNVNGSFAYFTASANPSGSTTSLTSKLGTDWTSSTIYSLIYATGKIFLMGDKGNFAVFNGGSTPSSGTYNFLRSQLSPFWASDRAVRTSSFIPNIATIYFGGIYGEFASYLIGYLNNKDGVSSGIDNTNQPILKATLTATATTPANTAITYYLSSDGGSTWNAVASGVEYTFGASGSDLRWKANLTTTDLATTPEITNIAINYSYYTSSTGSTNLKFNGGQYNSDQAVAWDRLSWSRTQPTNTTLTYKIRGASTEVGLASATWSNTIASTTSPVDLRTITIGVDVGLADSQWIELQADFSTSDGLNTPVLSDVTVSYVINVVPEVQNVTASQSTDGSKIVNISYQARDTDTNSNPTPSYQGKVSASFQYSINSGSNWLTPTMTSGAGLVSVNQISFTDQTAVWNMGADLADSFYAGTVMIKATVNDNELAHNTASANSAVFTIDTKNPVPGTIGSNTGVQINGGSSWTNNPAVDLALSATDDSAIQMQIRNDTNFVSNGYISYAATATSTLTSVDGNKTVYARFKDTFGNTADVNVSTLLDTTPPDIPGGIKIYDTSDQSLSRYSLTIIWNSVPAVGDFNNYIVERSVDGGAYSQLTTTTTTTHTDMSLDKTKTYSYKVRSSDIHSNSSNTSLVVTLKPSAQDVTGPILTGGLPRVTVSDVEATIAWSTDELADSFIEFGTTTNYGNTQGVVEHVTSHSVKLVGLSPKMVYHYRIRSTDQSSNITVGDDNTFETTLSPESTSSPKITGATAQKPGADPEEVTILWTTDKYASSQVLYGLDPDNLDSQTTEDTTLNKSHNVLIAKLKPNTKYYYKARSVDSSGNIVLGDIKYFVTSLTGNEVPTITNVEITDVTLGSAIVSWETTVVTTSIVEYGTDISYGSKVEDVSLGSTTKHVILLKNLQPGTEYHYRVLGTSQDEDVIFSNVDSNFKTQSFPTISSIAVKDVGSDKATITWKTDSESDSYIDFGSEKLDQSQGASDLLLDHAVTLIGLKPATKYSFKVKSRDKFGNLTTSDNQLFSTIVDTAPPQIKDLKSETSVITNANGESLAQAIVSWSTDEPATSQIKYSLGVVAGSDYPLSTAMDTNITTSHIVIISNLQLSATYHMVILSKDVSDNLAISEDYTVLTQNQDKSLIQYIVQILEERFFWLKKFGIFG